MRHEAWMSKSLPKNMVQCLACNHHCRIAEGRTGICGVRLNEKGKLYLLVYGRCASTNIDPIEKKPLYHFYPGAQIFSLGTVGCNFRCLFCQNWDISQFHKEHSLQEVEKAGEKLSPQKIVDYCLKRKIPAIAFTYNEPAIFFEYAYDTAKLAHENGLKIVYVSNGFESREALEKILPYLDAANIDIKSFREEYYQKICGGHLQPVLDNIKWLWKKGVWVETTTLIVTGENDSEAELTEIAKWQASVSRDMPWHVSRYFPAYKMNNPPTPLATLEKAYQIGKAAGLNYVYVGNVTGLEHEDTACPKCKKVVIKREGYLVENYLAESKCKNCGFAIAGVFN